MYDDLLINVVPISPGLIISRSTVIRRYTNAVTTPNNSSNNNNTFTKVVLFFIWSSPVIMLFTTTLHSRNIIYAQRIDIKLEL